MSKEGPPQSVLLRGGLSSSKKSRPLIKAVLLAYSSTRGLR